jgi:outer membrane protein assembly factor BamB
MICAGFDPSPPRSKHFRATLSLWDLANMRHIRDFETVYDFGGARIAVSPDGNLVASAAYNEGLAVYARDGTQLWGRKRESTQQVEFWDDQRLGISYGDLTYELCDALSGKVLSQLEIDRVFLDSSRDRYVMVDAMEQKLGIVDRRSGIKPLVGMTGYAAEVAYHPDEDVAFVSEHEGSFRCIELGSGSVRWERPFAGLNRPWVVYEQGRLLTFEIDPDTARGNVAIVDPSNGEQIGTVGSERRLTSELILSNPIRSVSCLGEISELGNNGFKVTATIRRSRNGGYVVKRV